ncbi:hypothetical protein ACEZDB_31460 [Streptacidiphilus sp. N1-3]|uniref:Uncharacterized protein n=1 Tax=Streptacidiphilus alkalitolerans TaxID=3342712 RepID=A0ABV6XA61_9ACTN
MIALALAGVAATATTATAQASPTAPPVSVGLDGSFDFHACPAGTPAADACLTDHVTGTLPGIGAVTSTFEVHIGYSRFAADGCGPIEKHGTFTAAGGSTVRLAAHGLYCNASSTASYTYTVTGGTRALAHASGRGQWLVPAPATYSDGLGTGTEYLYGTLHR